MTTSLPIEYDRLIFAGVKFHQLPGEKMKVLCVVLSDSLSGLTEKIWVGDGDVVPIPRILGKGHFLVSYFSSDVVQAFNALGWPRPFSVIDLSAEFLVRSNCDPATVGRGLLDALVYYGLTSSGSGEEEMRVEAFRDGPFSEEEKNNLLEDCEGDIDDQLKLYDEMFSDLDIPRALIRGRYMLHLASVESNGLPVDAEMVKKIKRNQDLIRAKAIELLDAKNRVYINGSFSESRYAALLSAKGINCPRSPSGRLRKDSDLLLDLSKKDPDIKNLLNLKRFLASANLADLPVGSDGRVRHPSRAFRTKTGRNAPAGRACIFAQPAWKRNLIAPPPGQALYQVDYVAQEAGVAAALSGDDAMWVDYANGDPYLGLAIREGAAPSGATKEKYAAVRARFKTACLGVLYGVGAKTLSFKLGIGINEAKKLLKAHKRAYRRFWEWQNEVVDEAQLNGRIRSPLGWQMRITAETKTTTIMNFPMQAAGGDMLRLSLILASEYGLTIVGLVHDAIIGIAPIDKVEQDALTLAKFMETASEGLLGPGHSLRTSTEIVRYPERFSPEKGKKMWKIIADAIEEAEREEPVAE